MDKQLNSLTHSAHLLDDLESIRELLGDADLQPPLLTETVEQIPLLLDEPSAEAPAAAAPAPAAAPEEDAQTRRQDTLLHLDA